MAYVDVADIRQHLRENDAFSDANILEMMEEVESYVANYISESPLPDNQPLLRSIIRDLTISRLIFNLTSAQGEAPPVAVELDRIANRKLYMIRTEGLETGTTGRGNVNNEVVSPYEPFWTIEDFIWQR